MESTIGLYKTELIKPRIIPAVLGGDGQVLDLGGARPD